MKKLIIRPILLSLVCVFSLYAGTYDDLYSPLMDQNESAKIKPDIFMSGDFKEIVRFDMLWFEGDSLSEEYKTHLKEIINSMKDATSHGDKILITIIGHTSEPTDDMNERSVQSRAYASRIERWFRYSLDSKTSLEKSKKYALSIQDALVDGGIDKNSTIVEYRGGKDMFFSDETKDGRNLSNRVMVTMYVLFPEKKESDSDADGVFDSFDECPNTPKDVAVDAKGCPVDTDKDGVPDYMDKCPDTPFGVQVDTTGCPIVVSVPATVSSIIVNDSDQDGVEDSLDKCPNTPKGSAVDANGCPITQNLHLNFESNSAKILKESYPKVVLFAEFMKNNPTYKVQIVGHTDSSGISAKNLILSQDRAESVKTALADEGIDISRITTAGRGELDPVADNRTLEGRRLNRRIEVKLSY